jgi:hypothetical protein
METLRIDFKSFLYVDLIVKNFACDSWFLSLSALETANGFRSFIAHDISTRGTGVGFVLEIVMAQIKYLCP